MATEIRVPTLGESVTEATIGKWFKKPGDVVKADEPLCELETDKVTLEVNAPAAGVLAEIVAKDGETVGVGALLGIDRQRRRRGCCPCCCRPGPRPLPLRLLPPSPAGMPPAPRCQADGGNRRFGRPPARASAARC
jgi:2-oxoglutarate dehydrogenase E2 component (dihydrolipoamide succinyltransferase)